MQEWFFQEMSKHLTAEQTEVLREMVSVDVLEDEEPEEEGALVQCQDCGAEDTPDKLVYQGKDGPEHTAPGSAFDYYLCQNCEGFYQRAHAAEDYEGDDAMLCKACGLLLPPGTAMCPVCLAPPKRVSDEE